MASLPAFSTGDTIDSFQDRGKMPSVRESLTMAASDSEIAGAESFRSSLVMLSGPALFPEGRDLSSKAISREDT